MDMTKFSTLIAMLLSASAGLPDEVQLFNGKDLDGWVAEGVREFVKDGRTLPVWSVKDGHLVCTGKGFGFLRYDRRTFADFVFHVEFRMAPGCNSGLGIRTRSFDPARSRATRPSFYGYEIQLFDDAGKPPTVHSSGSLYRYVGPSQECDPARGTVEQHRHRVRRPAHQGHSQRRADCRCRSADHHGTAAEAARRLRLPAESWRND